MTKKETLHDILEKISKARGKKNKIELLHEYSPRIKSFLELVYNPDIKWILEEGRPSFTRNTQTNNTSFWNYQKRLNIFVNMPPYKHVAVNIRQRSFESFLEEISPKDAEVLIQAKNKTLEPLFKITKEVVAEAFPIMAGKWAA